jgi:hypothetical protein
MLTACYILLCLRYVDRRPATRGPRQGNWDKRPGFVAPLLDPVRNVDDDGVAAEKEEQFEP